MRALLHCAVLVVLLAGAAPARAQGWLADRDATEGPGFRVGRLEIHPGIASEIGYESNVFLEANDPDGAFILRLSGHLDVSTLGTQRMSEGETTMGASRRKVAFRGGVGAGYYHYFLDRMDPNVEVDAHLATVINPDGRFSLRLADTYGRTIRPFADATPEGVRMPSYVRNHNEIEATLSMGSRSGLLQGVVSYGLNTEWFRDDQFDYLNSFTHRIVARASWRFLPQTAIVQNNEVEIHTYRRPEDDPVGLVANSIRVASSLGINGTITPRLSLTVAGGYSVGFYAAADEFESFNAQIEARYRPTERLSFTLGYFRKFNPSFIGNFVRSDRIHARGRYSIAGRLVLGLDGYVSFDETGVAFLADGMTPLGNQPRRNDLRFRLSATGEYRFTKWLGIIANVSYRQNVTDYVFMSDVPGSIGIIPDPSAAYRGFEAWLGVRASY